MDHMTPDRSAPGLLRAVGLLADGPVVWGRPLPHGGPGIFVVELPAPRATAPLELTRVGKWIERVDSFRLDGEPPTSRQVAARLGSFWLPSQPVLYVGATPVSVRGRVKALRETALGDRRPHAGGHWLHTLTGLGTARIWWAATEAVEEYEDAVFEAFAAGVPPDERAALHDTEVILPFANLRTPTGARKRTGLTGTLLAETVAPPPPATRIVTLPDGDAEGARGEPPEPRRRAAATTRARPATPAGTRSASTPSAAAIRAAGRANEPVHLTPEGEARLRAELEELVSVRRPEVVNRIRTAKELGDLKENADYTSAREEQSFLEGRVQAIEAQLRDAVIIEVPAAGSRVGLGSTVRIETGGEEITYALVGSAEADPGQGRISVASPVGRALVGHGPGDEIVVKTPRGEAHYRIVEVG
jgi:transcription elongation factor GreA